MKRFFAIVPPERTGEVQALADELAQALAKGSGSETVRLFHSWSATARQLPGPHIVISNDDFASAARTIRNPETAKATAELVILPSRAVDIATAMPPDLSALFCRAQKLELHVAQWFEDADS